jgi:hypothetical protein
LHPRAKNPLPASYPIFGVLVSLRLVSWVYVLSKKKVPASEASWAGSWPVY